MTRLSLPAPRGHEHEEALAGQGPEDDVLLHGAKGVVVEDLGVGQPDLRQALVDAARGGMLHHVVVVVVRDIVVGVPALLLLAPAAPPVVVGDGLDLGIVPAPPVPTLGRRGALVVMMVLVVVATAADAEQQAALGVVAAPHPGHGRRRSSCGLAGARHREGQGATEAIGRHGCCA